MQTFFSHHQRRFRLPLAAQVSLLLVLSALLPLAITIITSELLSRPQLIDQANAAMETDAQTHILAIENSFAQPIIDVRSLSGEPALAAYLAGDESKRADATHVLATGYQRNMNYVNWSLIDTQNRQRLFYPTSAQAHGPYLILPEDVRQLSSNTDNAVISSSYYSPQGNRLTVDIIQPVTTTDTEAGQVAGYVRATLNINSIWTMIQSEVNANGRGSYAFIVDENGVIIAHTDVSKVFTALAPFTKTQQENIAKLERYGQGTAIPVWPRSTLTNHARLQTAFHLTWQRNKEEYQVIGLPVFVVPWTYVVLSPTRVVTALANQQLLNTGLIGIIVLLLAATLGILMGQHITRPVLRSVTQLQSNSRRLKSLATQEQAALAQQTWVVDSSRVGLSSFDYYLSTSQNAMNHIIKIGKALESRWASLPPEERQRILRQVFMATHYIDTALQQQKLHGRQLSAALDLTQQVTEQANASAEAAAQAAEQMEEVVSQLQQVVGQAEPAPEA